MIFDTHNTTDFLAALLWFFLLICSYESRPNGGFSVFYTLPENTVSKPETSSSDRLAKLIREVNKNVIAQGQNTNESDDETGEVDNEDDDKSYSYEDKSKEVEAKPAKEAKGKAKKTKKKKEDDGKYREDYYEDGSYNEDYYSYENTDPTYLDQPPDKSGLQPCFIWQTYLNLSLFLKFTL